MRCLVVTVCIPSFFACLARAAFQNDFSAYPQKTQQCLYAAASSSGCKGDTVGVMNSCLCSNGGHFVTQTATCLGTSDAAELGTVYDTMSAHCADSKTPLSVSKSQFLQSSGVSSSTTKTGTTTTAASTSSMPKSTVPTTADSTASTATSATEALPTSTSGPDKSSDEGTKGGEGGGGLSSQAVAGILAGSISTGLLLLGLVGFWFFRRKGKTQARREEAHPMLSPKFGSLSIAGASEGLPDGPGEGNGGLGMAAMGHDGLEVVDDRAEDAGLVHGTAWKADQKWRPSGFNWESPYEPAWNSPPPGVSSPHSWGHLPPAIGQVTDHGRYGLVEPHIHELAAPETHVPIELAGAPVERQQYSGAGWGPGK